MGVYLSRFWPQIDLCRTKGLWYHSVRYAFLFGIKRGGDISYKMPSEAEFQEVAKQASDVFQSVVSTEKKLKADLLLFATSKALTMHFGSRDSVLGVKAGLEEGNIKAL